MDSKRIRTLKREIINIVPKFPNNKATKKNLESKHLTDLLIVYLNWAARLITPRARKVEIESEVTNDDRWDLISSSFSFLREKIENGDDLTPHLSLKAQEKGYTPAASESGSATDKWADKDFLLNIMNFYHFHLGEINEGGKNISERSPDLIFARVDKFTFRAIGIFHHSVFKPTNSVTKEMSSERRRLWQIFDKYVTQGVKNGGIVIPAMITTSGHCLQIVQLAQEYFRIIKEVDSKLDDREFVKSFFEDTDIRPPKEPKLNWCFRGTDLGIFDKATNLFVVYKYGIN